MIKRELENVTKVPKVSGDSETLSHQDMFLESMEMVSGEINVRLSQEMDSLLSMIHTQTNRAISSAISVRVIPEHQIINGTLSLGQNAVGTGTSACNQGIDDKPKGSNVNLTKKDSRPASDFREDVDLTHHNVANQR